LTARSLRRFVGAGTSTVMAVSSMLVTQAQPVDVDPNQVVRRPCLTCHNDQSLRGNLSLEYFDVHGAEAAVEVTAKLSGIVTRSDQWLVRHLPGESFRPEAEEEAEAVAESLP